MAAVLDAGAGWGDFYFRLRCCTLGDPGPGLLVPVVPMVALLPLLWLRGSADQEEGLPHRPRLPGEQQRLARVRVSRLSRGLRDLPERRAVREAQHGPVSGLLPHVDRSYAGRLSVQSRLCSGEQRKPAPDHPEICDARGGRNTMLWRRLIKTLSCWRV